MKTIKVKRIANKGIYGEYPALKNVDTGRVYVDITLGIDRFLKADGTGHNIHGQFVGYNIPGAWNVFENEPVCSLRSDIAFELVEKIEGTK